MSKIKNKIIKDTSVLVPFDVLDEIKGFKVNVRYLSREELTKIRNASLVFKFNKSTRQKEEEVDSDKFLTNYAEAAILGWEGLKMKHLPYLLPVDISDSNPEEPIEFSLEDAVELLGNSTLFDQFITSCMQDYEIFSKKKTETDVKN